MATHEENEEDADSHSNIKKINPVQVNVKRPKLDAPSASASTDALLALTRVQRKTIHISQPTPLTIAEQLAEYHQTPSEGQPLLQFWIQKRQAWPELGALALRTMSIQATEVACERVFSWATAIFTKGRSQLGPERFVELLTVYSTLKSE